MATPEELHKVVVRIGRSNPQGHRGASKYLKRLDYSVLQQCIHCGMCLPTCPTYDETKLERNSPRGRIALMRRVADGQLEVTQAFGQELYFCLGCLTCETVCPAGVRYGEMFEHARADIEQAGVMRNPQRDLVRELTTSVCQSLRALPFGFWLSGVTKHNSELCIWNAFYNGPFTSFLCWRRAYRKV